MAGYTRNVNNSSYGSGPKKPPQGSIANPEAFEQWRMSRGMGPYANIQSASPFERWRIERGMGPYAGNGGTMDKPISIPPYAPPGSPLPPSNAPMYAARPDAGSPPVPPPQPQHYGYAQRPDFASFPPVPIMYPDGGNALPKFAQPKGQSTMYAGTGLSPGMNAAAKKGRGLIQYGMGGATPKVSDGVQSTSNALNSLLLPESQAAGAMEMQRAGDAVNSLNSTARSADLAMRGGGLSPQEIQQRRQNIDAQNQMANKWGEMGPEYFEQQGAQRRAELEQKYPQYATKQPSVPWAGNAAYDNVEPNVRGRIANRMDPTSWATYTRTPGEINAQIGQRTDRHLAELRERNFDPYNSRGGYQYSPVNPGIVGLNNREQAAMEAEREKTRQFYRNKKLQVAERAQAAGRSVDEQYKFEARQGAEKAKYDNYVRNSAKFGGERPMSYSDWVAAGGSKNPASKALEDQAWRDRSARLAQREADREAARGPNYQRSAYLARYGVPMAMPNDPGKASAWTQRMAQDADNAIAAQAMAGNRYALDAYSQRVAQAGENTRAATNAEAVKSGYQAQLEAAKYRADKELEIAQGKLEYETGRANNPTFPEAVGVMSQISPFDPDAAFRKDYSDRLSKNMETMPPSQAHEDAMRYATEQRPMHIDQYNRFAKINGAEKFGVTAYDPNKPLPPVEAPKPVLPDASTGDRRAPTAAQIESYRRKFRDENNGREPTQEELNRMLERDRFKPEATTAPPDRFGKTPTLQEIDRFDMEFRKRHGRGPTPEETSKYFGVPVPNSGA